jgi:hypothetical protein
VSNDKEFINTRAGKLINRKSTYHLHGGTKESHASLFFEIRTRNLKNTKHELATFSCTISYPKIILSSYMGNCAHKPRSEGVQLALK